MRFELNPQLILTKDEMETLNKALKLCQDMDNMTSGVHSCAECPLYDNCTHTTINCIYITAKNALKRIIDIATVK